jgi:hypothetical protein
MLSTSSTLSAVTNCATEGATLLASAAPSFFASASANASSALVSVNSIASDVESSAGSPSFMMRM